MPLIKGKSEKAFKKNLETEMEAGKPQKQSLAIAYAVKRRAKKMAKGGMIKNYDEGGDAQNSDTSSASSTSSTDSTNSADKPYTQEDKEAFSKGAQSSHSINFDNIKKGLGLGKAYGGDAVDQSAVDMDHSATKNVPESDSKEEEPDYKDYPSEHARFKSEYKDIMHKTFGGEGADAVDSGMFAEGGESELHDNVGTGLHMLDMIGRIMKKRAKMYSEGGKVANGGEDDLNELADGMPNNFDDLSMRDDLESSYTGENSGDELDDEQEEKDRKDIVSKIMASRKKKDRLPSPR